MKWTTVDQDLPALPGIAETSAADRIALEIRSEIQNGKLQPGQRLVERRLAAQLGVSHIPVREALARLVNERLVERTPRRGARVAILANRDLAEISSLRIVLEQFVIVRVQERWNSAIEEMLTQIVQNMVASARVGDTDQMFALDKQFHESLWKASDHQLLMTMSAQLRDRINGFLRAAVELLGPQERVAHALSHKDILDALDSGDPQKARAATAEHIEVAASRIELRHRPS